MDRSISGDDWEEEIVALLYRRYPNGDFLPVPADDGGDLGMDGVGRDGVVYQCYSPVEPLSNKDRTAKHQGKIYSDLNKLVERQDEHGDFLNSIVVKRWILIVPKLSSRKIQEYANKRAEVVRAANVDYIADDFEAIVVDGSFLAAERKALVNGVLRQLRLNIQNVDESDIEAWSHGNAKFINNLRSKLSKLEMPQNHTRASIEHKYLHRYMVGRGLLDHLSGEHAELYELLVATKASFELELEQRSELSSMPGGERILDEVERFQCKLSEAVNGDLASQHVVQLCQEAVSDWLMKCPLDFPGPRT